MRPVFCLAAALAAGLLAVSALSMDRGERVSATRAFSLNGRWYSVGETTNSDFVVRKTLGGMGLDTSRVPPDSTGPGGCILDALAEMRGKQGSGMVPVPSCFREEDRMHLETGDGSIGIGYGKISTSTGRATDALARSGWNLAGTEDPGKPFRFATIRKGKETWIVLLEEKEGSYLSIRQREK